MAIFYLYVYQAGYSYLFRAAIFSHPDPWSTSDVTTSWVGHNAPALGPAQQRGIDGIHGRARLPGAWRTCTM